MKISIIAAVTLMATTASSPEGIGPRADVVYHTAFYLSGEPKWEDIPLTGSFSAGTLRSIPFASGSFVMIGLQCESLTSSGRLRDCKVSFEPEGEQLGQLAEQMADDLRIDRLYAERNADRIKFISIQIRASNSDGPARSGPCWPPTCHFIPFPPPPPPPPPQVR